MTTGAPVTTDQPPITSTPPAQGGANADPPPQQQPPPAQTQGGASADPPPPAGPKRVRLGDDGDIPDDAELLEMNKGALKKRMERYSSKQLKDRFGTDDPDAIKAKLDKADQYEKTQEEARRAALSREQKLEEDLAKERGRRKEWENRYKGSVRSQVITREHDRVTTLAKAHLDPDYLDSELGLFRSHLRDNFTKDQLKAMTDEQIEGWFKERVEKKPKLGKDFGTQVQDQKPPPPKVPLSNGVASNDKPGVGANNGSSGAPVNGDKTFKPGLPNSMSTQEARAAAAKQGHHW